MTALRTYLYNKSDIACTHPDEAVRGGIRHFVVTFRQLLGGKTWSLVLVTGAPSLDNIEGGDR